MPVFKRLIQTPSSPDKNLKSLSGADKYKASTFARLADVNELSRDVNDAKAYTLALVAAASGNQDITTKKGVIKITTTNTGALNIGLVNSEILLVDANKYFVQVSVAHPTINTIATVIPISTDGSIEVRIAQLSGTTAWATVYLNYEIVKIGD
jgi:hypothetical protein